MSSDEKTWPQKYGFKIVGNGPTFIVSVAPGSEAEESGLVPGDKIMELDGHDISGLSADVLTILMKQTNDRPPAVGIIPSIFPIYLTCTNYQRCGFTVTNKKPIIVSHVEPTGIAFAAGLRKGDIILAVNNKPITKFGRRELVLIAENESVVLSTIPTGMRESTITDDFRGPQIRTSKFLFAKVAKYCGKDYHKKMTLVGVLTEYSKDWDIHSLCLSLDSILKDSSDRKLLKHIEPFIPRHQKDIFKPLLKKKKLYKDCNHLAYMPNEPAQKLSLRILRGDNPYGFVIKGSSPAHVEWLDPGGPTDSAGFQPGDFIVSVNEIDTRSFSHDQVIKLLQFCGPVPTIEVERYAISMNEVGNNISFDTISNISSTFSMESFSWICREFNHVTDAEGWSFKAKMEYLLTARERAQLQTDFLQYINARDIVKLYQSLKSILDSPSRRTLWQFLLTKMSTSHKEYIHLKENVSETLQNRSMKNQLEYYLNYKDEIKMKDALDLYLRNRSFEQLKIIQRILNTPAKEELWNSIFPHLIPEHLHIIRKQREEQTKIFAKFHQGVTSKRSSHVYLPPSSESNWEGNDSEEEFKLLEAAVDFVHISDDSLPSNLSSEDDLPSINSVRNPHMVPDFYGNTMPVLSSSSLSKSPKLFSPHNFTESKLQPRKRGESASHISANGSHNQMTSNRLMPEKPKRKTMATNKQIHKDKNSIEAIRPSNGSGHFASNQKAPSLPNVFLMPPANDDFETRSLHLPKQQRSSKPGKSKESKDPHYNYPKRLPSSAKRHGPLEGNYDKNNDDGDDDDSHSKVPDRRMDLQNKEQNQSKIGKNSPAHNSHNMTSVFTYGNAKNGIPESTTFGNIKRRHASSNGRITPNVVEDHRKETNNQNHEVTNISGTQDPNQIQQNTPIGREKFNETNTENPSAFHHEESSLSTQKPQRLKNGEILNVDIDQNTMNTNVMNHAPEIDVDSESRTVNTSTKSGIINWYLSHVDNQESNIKAQSEPLTKAKQKSLNSIFKNYEAAADDDKGRHLSKPTIDTNVSVMEKIRELEAQKNIQKPPPPPIPPALPLPGDRNDVLEDKSVKHLHWEKIDENSAQDTIWAKSNENMEDVLPLLMLETNFGRRKAKAQPITEKKKEFSILNYKKAYNISILLGHLKLSISDIKTAILEMDDSILTVELLQQLITYAPDAAEIKKYENLAGETQDLSQADLFSYEMIQIPNYEDRIRTLIFKANFTERTKELKTIIANLKSASVELRESELLANILQLILAMGNYLNRGNKRIAGASGFRISFLTQIDSTKTSDNKTTLLHVLATAVVKKYPNSYSLHDELSSVIKASRVSSTDVYNEIQELKSSQENITSIIEGLKDYNSSDKIQEIMTDFLANAKETTQTLLDSLEEALKEFQITLYYFGEADHNTNTQKVFDIFATFVNKFEKSLREISMK